MRNILIEVGNRKEANQKATQTRNTKPVY